MLDAVDARGDEFRDGLLGEAVGRDARARFDIIGVNPRGTGDAPVALCEGKQGQPLPPFPDYAFPVTPQQIATQLSIDAANRALCKQSNPPILRHMSTADSARDIDAVRAETQRLIDEAKAAGQAKVDAIVRHNPHVLLARCDQRGYGLADITPARWTTTLRVVDDPLRADSGASTLARFVVEDGRAGPQAA